MAEPGVGASIFLNQTEARRAEKIFFEIGLPLSQDLDDRLPPPPPVYLKVCILHYGATIGVGFREGSVRRELVVIRR